MLQRINIHNLALISDLEIDFSGELNVFTGETGAGILKDGRNEIRVNGKQITTVMLRELMQNYVDIYGQNEYQSLLKVTEQRKILDYFVFKKDDAPLKKQKELYDEYKKLRSDMASLGDSRARAQRIDILNYQIEEIERAAVKEGEEERLVDRRHLLMAAERIKNGLAECVNRLDGDDGASSALADATHSIGAVSSYGESFEALYARLKPVRLVARLDKIRALKNKYGSFEQMNKFLSSAKEELNRAENGEEEYAEMVKREQKLKRELFDSCCALSEMRRAGAKSLEKDMLTELGDLGMAKSKFEARFSPSPDFDNFTETVTANGFDAFEFYLSPNPGQPLLPLAKIISGGEMSRFMLAIKLITGNLGGIGTMIFDEIDTGISGAIGLSVAKKLCRLSRGRQVLCVTHLPQIAAMADAHFYIEKSETDGNTHTRVSKLDRKGQIGEVARLSGTLGVSDFSEKNAEEPKTWSDNFKK